MKSILDHFRRLSPLTFLIGYILLCVSLLVILSWWRRTYSEYLLFLLLLPIVYSAYTYPGRFYLALLAVVLVIAFFVINPTTPVISSREIVNLLTVLIIMMLICEMLLQYRRLREEAEQSLNKEIDIIRRAISQAHSVPYQLDYADGNYSFMGEGIQELTGLPASEITPESWHQLVLENHLRGELEGLTMEEAIHRTRSGDILHWNNECKIRTQSGDVKWVEDNSIEIMGSDNKPIRSIGILQDVSKHKDLVNLLESKNHVLDQIAKGRPLSAILETIAREIERQYPNMYCSILLLDEEGISLRNGASPSLPKEYVKAIDGFPIGPNRGSCGTAAYYNKDIIVTDTLTDPRWKDFRNLAEAYNLRACWSIPIFSSHNTVLGTFAVYYSTPQAPQEEMMAQLKQWTYLAGIAIEAKQVELALRENEQYFRALIENAPDMILILDKQGNIRFASPSAERIFGTPVPRLLNTSLLRFLHPEDRERVLNLVWTMVERRVPSSGWLEMRLRQEGGDWRTVEARGSNLLDDPAVRGIIINARDVTDRKETEAALQKSLEQLQQVQKIEAVGRLAGGVAHDFNNLLTIVEGNCELIKVSHELDATLAARIEDIQKAVEYGASLTRQLLAFSRRQVLQPKIIDLNKVVDESGNLLKRIIGEHIALKTELHPDPVWILADPTQFHQVIMNLALNARDAMLDGGTLQIQTSLVGMDPNLQSQAPELKAGEYARLCISDTGVGMNPDMQKHVFEPFFTTKEIGQGSGLGLATVYGIIKQSDGVIHLSSEPMQGTTFDIFIPSVVSKEAPQPVKSPEPAYLANGETILLVEDDDTVRFLSCQILENEGYRVLSAGNGIEALRVCKNDQNPIDLLMTDIVMPQMNGVELANHLRKRWPHLKVLYVSGYLHDGLVSENIQLDPHALFLNKPFKPRDLIHIVHILISQGKNETSPV